MKTRLSTPSKALALLAGTALLAACGTTRLPDDQSTASAAAATPVATSTPRSATAAQPSATPQSGVATVNLAGGAAGGTASAGAAALLALPSQRIVYFDFDSFAIKDDFKPLLDGYARVLAANGGKKLMIEGHTDERGGREYNLALGQKRAAAVVSSLKLLGVNEAQMEAVSFGEERPSAQGADESAWAKNRRAELKDR
jgi:peptidoglycan-associated lipoprotein